MKILMLSIILALTACIGDFATAASIYVGTNGNDENPGTAARPLLTVGAAQSAARMVRTKSPTVPVDVVFEAGTYYLPQTLVFTSKDSGSASAPVTYSAAPGARVVWNGGFPLDLHWTPYKNGIMQAALPNGITTDQLYVNDIRQPMARYPNYDPAQRIFNGYAADAISPDRVKTWSDPTGGFIHVMQAISWGSLEYVITGKDAAGNLTYKGGWQINRQNPMSDQFRYVENIFEELDAPGEWYDNTKTGILYYYPPAGVNLSRAVVEGVRLTRIVEFDGSEADPVRFVNVRGITFRGAARTFMSNDEPILRSDWTISRNAAIFFDGAVDCGLFGCYLDQVGGNGIFINNYNRRVTVQGCHIFQAGASGIAVVGDPKSVRNAVGWNGSVDYKTMDRTPGPQSDNYPSDCMIDDCLIHDTGQFEKQSAGVEIDIAKNITVRHCSIYHLPRAGINIGDGAFGGHLVEDCDIFDTVLETGDHGSFNSWGRDSYWQLGGVNLNNIIPGPDQNLPLLDVISPIVLRHNRWRCDHGWDIDLDDGSSNYIIEDNLCLHGGIKNREGFYRVVQNNIMVDGTYDTHVWFADSQDIFKHNIIFSDYMPIGMPPVWGSDIDDNLWHQAGAGSQPASKLQQQSGRDQHSIIADAQFVDPATGDYRVKPGSPALALGFVNFRMDNFGVTDPALRAIASQPVLPGQEGATSADPSIRDASVYDWLGASIHNVSGLGELSAAGLPGEVGVWIDCTPPGSEAERAGLKQSDVILKAAGQTVGSIEDFVKVWNASAPGMRVRLDISRSQKPAVVFVTATGKPLTPLVQTKLDRSSRTAFEGDLLTDNLTGLGKATCSGAIDDNVPNEGGGSGPDAVRNGTTLNSQGGQDGLNDGKTFRGYGTGSSLIFELNTSLHPGGYDITRIATFSGHFDARASQSYTVSVSTVAAPTKFTDLIPMAQVTTTSGSSEIIIGDGQHLIVSGDAGQATGIAAVRFDFKDGQLGYDLYREIQIAGKSTGASL